MRRLKDEWEANLYDKKNNTLKLKNDKLIVENTSLNAARPFAGDDLNFTEKEAQKRAQMKEWLTQQLQEQKYKKDMDRQSNEKYDEMVRLLTEIREQDEKAELEFRKNAQLQMIKDNEQVCVYACRFIYIYYYDL